MSNERGHMDISTLLDAAASGDLETVRAVLDTDPSLAGTRGWPIGTTPLIVAAHRGHVPIVALLLERGAPVDQRELSSDTTALHWASEGGRVAVAEELLAAGAALDGVDTWYGLGPVGWGSVVHCAPYGQDDRDGVVELLVARGAPRDPFSAVIRGWTDALRPEGRLRFVGSGRTPLHLAAGAGAEAAVVALLAAGADPSEMDDYGTTPRALDKTGKIPLDPSDLGARLLGGDPTAAAGADPRLLHLVAERGDADAVRALLGAGVDPDLRAVSLVQELASEVTPLYRASLRGHLAAVDALLVGGADPRWADPVARNTALHVAAAAGHTDTALRLVAAGADLLARDRFHDSTPSGWAAYGGHPELARALEG